MTNPSIWTPGQAVSAESSNRVQTFIASAGQTDFIITNFTYETGTNSLEVSVSGVTQRPGIDYIETGSNSFSLTSPVEDVGTAVFVRGLVEVSGNPQVVSDASNVSYLTETVKTALDVRLPEIANYAVLRAYAGLVTAYYVRGVTDIFDGGAGVFRVDAADTTTADNGGTVLVDASGRRWKREFADNVNIRWFGAVGDGVTDDTAAINATIAAVGLAGGGTVFFPAGTYLVSNSNPGASSWDNRVAIWVKANNVHLVGAGRGSTKILLAGSSNAHAVKFGQRDGGTVTVSNCSVSHIEIDGNRANQSVPTVTDDHWSGVDIASGCESIYVSDFYIHDTQYYGIGVERNGFKDIIIENGRVKNTGADGIDIKDDDGTNRACFVRNVSVDSFGLSGALSQQAGINPRGGTTVSDVVVTGFSGDKCGIRFDGGITASNPAGSILNNFIVVADAKDSTEGVQVNSASFPQFVSITNGRIGGCDIGLDARYVRSLFSNIEASNCNIGFQTYAENQFDNVYALGCTTSGYKCVGSDNTFTNVNARSNAIGLTVDSAQTGNQFHVGTFISNTSNVSDSGTYTAISKISGINTESVGTASVDIASTGEKTIIIPHGLHFTPSLENVSLTLQRVTSGITYVIGFMNVYLADSTNLYCKVYVATAATAGSTVTLMATCKAKKALRQ